MKNEAGKIRIALVSGSARPGNYTMMALQLVADELLKDPHVAIDLIDPRELSLPLPGTDPNSPDAKKLRETISSAAAVVLATPKYHGSYSSVIKLIIENLGHPSPMAGKPVALIGVAAGSIGAIKAIEHLRSVVSHIGGISLPLPVSVANVQKVFDATGTPQDPAMEKYIRGLATNLLNYLHKHVCPAVTLERILREGVSAATSNPHIPLAL